MAITEVIPGVFHWTAVHPNIGSEVASYWLEDGGVLIDPLLPPEEGIEWFAERSQAPAAIVLSNRHHYRHSGELAERYEIPVYCVSAGLHEFGGERPVRGFEFGDELPGGIVTREIDAICPDETALYLSGHAAIVFADGVVRGDAERLGFVPDYLMDDPEETKRTLIEAFARALDELEFQHVLLAHGGPVIGDGRARLQELVDACRGS